MTRQEAIQRLETSLTKALNDWTQVVCETEESAWAEMGYVGNDLQRLMSKAAMAVLESQADLSDYYNGEDMLKD